MSSDNPYIPTTAHPELRNTRTNPMAPQLWQRLTYVAVFSGSAIFGFVCGFALDDGFRSAISGIGSQPHWVLGANTSIFMIESILVGVFCHCIVPYRTLPVLMLRAATGGFVLAFLMVSGSLDSLSPLEFYACLLGASATVDCVVGALTRIAG